ncbi:TetR/AcrR family transcriptional regulator, partial [uncultured Phenylobacterium sp.]|uniref:TetR/AcrR family transcriptional regulator n=1 Tax=uncultured Phenylobacterium sp. TaxID=349273 RepID=UPI0025F2C60F
MDLFAERGFERTRFVDVAKRAGVSHGTVGVYFPTKEALLRGVVERMAEPEMDQVVALIDGFQGTTAELLETLGLLWWEHCQEERITSLMRVVEAELGNFPELAETFRERVYDPVIDLFGRILKRGVERGELACEDPTPYAELAFGGLS